MQKRFLIGILLIFVIFLSFVLIRESAKKYNYGSHDIIKNYNFMK